MTVQDVLPAGPETGFEGGVDAVLAELVDVLTTARPRRPPPAAPR